MELAAISKPIESTVKENLFKLLKNCLSKRVQKLVRSPEKDCFVNKTSKINGKIWSRTV